MYHAYAVQVGRYSDFRQSARVRQTRVTKSNPFAGQKLLVEGVFGDNRSGFATHLLSSFQQLGTRLQVLRHLWRDLSACMVVATT
jgi:hypothetical protein